MILGCAFLKELESSFKALNISDMHNLFYKYFNRTLGRSEANGHNNSIHNPKLQHPIFPLFQQLSLVL